MKPQSNTFVQEDILVDEFINAEITEITYDKEHKSSYQGIEKVGPAVQITMKLDGYKQPKKSRWMAFIYTEKSNLYKVWLKSLVPNARPYMDFDLDNLKSMKIKALFSKNTGKNGEVYYNLDMVKPLKPKAEKIDDLPEIQIGDLGGENTPF